MSLHQQLQGRHARLERELAKAFSTQPWPGALIDRLVNELADTECAMAAQRAAEEQRSAPAPRFAMQGASAG